MCKHHRTIETLDEPQPAYTGATVQLGSAPAMSPRRARSRCGGGFPWWTLWLIWPLAGVLKTIVPAVSGGLIAVSQAGIVVPLALIVLGLVLLRWR